MYLYVIENCDNGQVKIGYSLNPQRRCAALQTGSSSELRLAHTAEVADDRARILEQHLHKEMSYARVRGEWFSMPVAQAIGLVDHCVIRWHDDPLLG